jgi:transposase
MDSKELYRVLLGLSEPWGVERVELDAAGQDVSVLVTHPARMRFRCPRCEREHAVFDPLAERRWRHLDSCQFMAYHVARPPRIECAERGRLQIELPWAGARGGAWLAGQAVRCARASWGGREGDRQGTLLHDAGV